MDLGFPLIACCLPSGDLLPNLGDCVDAAVQTLTVHYADLDLGHVQPTGVLGRVMKFQFLQDAPSLIRRKGLVQTRSRVRVQVVHHQADLPGVRIMHIHQIADTLGPVLVKLSRKETAHPMQKKNQRNSRMSDMTSPAFPVAVRIPAMPQPKATNSSVTSR